MSGRRSYHIFCFFWFKSMPLGWPIAAGASFGGQKTCSSVSALLQAPCFGVGKNLIPRLVHCLRRFFCCQKIDFITQTPFFSVRGVAAGSFLVKKYVPRLAYCRRRFFYIQKMEFFAHSLLFYSKNKYFGTSLLIPL